MENLPLPYLYGLVAILVVLSAYFSSTETAMMALNRYRLLHLAKQGHRGALRASRLLERPDRLLGTILLGNNAVNFFAATVGTLIALRQFGELGVLLAPFVLTFIFLVLAEVAPKTIAAYAPERIAYPSSFILTPLLRVLYPLVWILNGLANALAQPFLKSEQYGSGAGKLSMDELRTLVHEGAALPVRRQDMLLSILDLEKVTVEDIMVPRAEINGIDIEDDLSEIVEQICATSHTRLPVFKGNINEVLGILHMRHAARFLRSPELTKAALMQETQEPYFVPEGTPLHVQLLKFQNAERRIGLVVDEYGDVQGIVTLEDILEEIVGEFTSDLAARIPEVHPQDDGSHIIDGTALLRDINRALHWELPLTGPRTLNGLILEHLEIIPDSPCCLEIGEYRIEVLQIKDNMVRTARVTTPVDTTEVPSDDG
ncbi:MAG: HlyC/CorC family transporter [Gammaproteobacteria bacterium]|nr:HlyC/CorC family transporter [Gammaproteobacteria bacterium]